MQCYLFCGRSLGYFPPVRKALLMFSSLWKLLQGTVGDYLSYNPIIKKKNNSDVYSLQNWIQNNTFVIFVNGIPLDVRIALGQMYFSSWLANSKKSGVWRFWFCFNRRCAFTVLRNQYVPVGFLVLFFCMAWDARLTGYPDARIVMGLKTENVFFLGLTFSIKEDKLDSQLFNLS